MLALVEKTRNPIPTALQSLHFSSSTPLSSLKLLLHFYGLGSMSCQLVLYVDRLVRPVNVETVTLPTQLLSDPSPATKSSDVAGPSSSAPLADSDDAGPKHDEDGGEDEPLIPNAECRICQEEDSISNLEIPCACSGSLKYAHRKCVQHWCNEKGDTICEICNKPYQPGYVAPTPCPNPEETAIDIGGGWTISGTPLDLHDPRILAIAEAERQFLETEYDEYAVSNASGAAFCGSAALILMALLLLRHAVSVPDADADDDPSTVFSIILLRAAGFLLPCYIMAWAISSLQRRRQRQEAAALAATQVAFVLQSGQRRGLQFAIAPGPQVNTQPEHIV